MFLIFYFLNSTLPAACLPVGRIGKLVTITVDYILSRILGNSNR